MQRRPENIEKAPAGSVLSVPLVVGVNLCCCVGCKIIKGTAGLDKLLYGAAGGLGLRHLKSSNLLCFPCFSFTARFSAIIRAIPRSSNFYALQLKDIAILKVNYKSSNCNRTKIGCEIISN